MAFSAAAVANIFLHLAGRDGREITPLKMQKLVYFAHGWHLALFERPLLAETVQAWQFGPVIGSLYQVFKQYGAHPIQQLASVPTQYGPLPADLEHEAPSVEEFNDAMAVIERVWEEYGGFSASRLTNLTHSPESPWSQISNKEIPERAIPNQVIGDYFRAQIGEEAAA